MKEELLFDEAFKLFLKQESENIAFGTSERNLCAHLMCLFDALKASYGFGEYYADVEYNRKQGGNVKTIIGENLEVIKIVPDLILHSRGEKVGQDNVIVVEMKKKGRKEEYMASDRYRLIAMTKSLDDQIWPADGNKETDHPEHVCGYQLGVFVVLDPKGRTYEIEKYKRGACVGSDTGSF